MNNREELFAVCGPGMFTGEMTVLTGRRGLVRIRAAEATELIKIDRCFDYLNSKQLGKFRGHFVLMCSRPN